MKLIDEIIAYQPQDELEEIDKKVMLDTLKNNPRCLRRDSYLGHFTASSMIFNSTLDKVCMAYHLIYDSYAWSGGHMDGEEDGLKVALKEAYEETGLRCQPLCNEAASIEILPVAAHKKRGKMVNHHLHLNVSYLLIADENQPLVIKPDENKAVDWFFIDELERHVKEKDMLPIYRKLIERALSKF